jgi:replicative DNA helicase
MQKSRFELEMCVAGAVLLDNGAGVHIDLSLDDFQHLPARATIAAARQHGCVDPVIAKSWATENGLNVKVSDVSEMLLAVPTARNFITHLVELKASIYRDEIAKLRREVQQKAKDADLVELAREVAERESALAAKYLEYDQKTDLISVGAELLNRIEHKIDNANLTPTGWDILDELHGGGLMPNEVVIIAARPSVGKTAAALQICADCGLKSVLFSLEMSKEQIAPRLLAATALQNTKIASRKPSGISDEVRNTLLTAAPDFLQISERIAVYDRHDQNIETIRRNARKEVENGARLVVIDYLQLLDKKAESRERAVSQISRELKNMSKELSVPVIVLAQLNRACESEKRLPRLSDLRESGAIEQDANSVLFIHDTGGKTTENHKRVMIIAAKGRDVGLGNRMAVFNHDHQRFYRSSNQEEPS